jgi:hypothetical protein
MDSELIGNSNCNAKRKCEFKSTPLTRGEPAQSQSSAERRRLATRPFLMNQPCVKWLIRANSRYLYNVNATIATVRILTELRTFSSLG